MKEEYIAWLLYDIEIISCIPQKNVPINPQFIYCAGWHDHESMGISCISTYTFWDNAYRIFESDKFSHFQLLVKNADCVIGFNSLSFDDKVCAANDLEVATDYDLLSEVWVSAGLPPKFIPGSTTPGYSLENLAQANLGFGKSGDGGLAAALWQEGRRERVKAYCLQDVFLSVEILKLGWAGKLVDPVDGKLLQLRKLNSLKRW